MNKFIYKHLSNNKGLSLVELIIVLILINVVLAIGYGYYYFGTRSFTVGESRADVQQNVRLATEFVANNVRFADDLEIFQIDDTEDLVYDKNFNYFYIDIEEKKIMHRKIKETESSIIFPVVNQNIDFDLHFERSSTNILAFVITGKNDHVYSLESEVLLANVTSISGHNEGVAIRYTSPSPPEPAIRRVTLSEQGHIIGEPPLDLHMKVFTSYVEPNVDITYRIFQMIGDPDSPTEDTLKESDTYILNDNPKTINIDYSFVDQGEYIIEVIVDTVKYPYFLTYSVSP
ncbi:PilW family protein [Dethiobacter alkaliphilus]|nr:prepilin-type N-terminal cleavage/methylation domain-containing protein [Dethiobacter alkaliphilus]